MIDVDWDSWRPHYESIAREFGFGRAEDEAAARALASRLSLPRVDSAWQEAAERIRGRPTIVVGAGDDAPKGIRMLPRWPLVAADGAASACKEAGRSPDLIVTDLDGNVEDEVEAASKGAIVAIHAHGDNMEAVGKWFGAFPPDRVVGTCQTRPLVPLRNHGGFTDGDRACFVADALGASELHLVGFDFSGRVGRFTGQHDPRTKPRKLQWAKRLLEELRAGGARIQFH